MIQAVRESRSFRKAIAWDPLVDAVPSTDARVGRCDSARGSFRTAAAPFAASASRYEARGGLRLTTARANMIHATVGEKPPVSPDAACGQVVERPAAEHGPESSSLPPRKVREPIHALHRAAGLSGAGVTE